jgi:hypothetical protein
MPTKLSKMPTKFRDGIFICPCEFWQSNTIQRVSSHLHRKEPLAVGDFGYPWLCCQYTRHIHKLCRCTHHGAPVCVQKPSLAWKPCELTPADIDNCVCNASSISILKCRYRQHSCLPSLPLPLPPCDCPTPPNTPFKCPFFFFLISPSPPRPWAWARTGCRSSGSCAGPSQSRGSDP